jgi:predicted nucleotidyltransferase
MPEKNTAKLMFRRSRKLAQLLVKAYPEKIDAVFVVGSVAANMPTNHSDIDLVVVTKDETPDFWGEINLKAIEIARTKHPETTAEVRIAPTAEVKSFILGESGNLKAKYRLSRGAIPLFMHEREFPKSLFPKSLIAKALAPRKSLIKRKYAQYKAGIENRLKANKKRNAKRFR